VQCTFCTPVGLTRTAAEDAAVARAQVNASSAQDIGMLQAQQQRMHQCAFNPCLHSVQHNDCAWKLFYSTPVVL
jgi:hypothetical protein